MAPTLHYADPDGRGGSGLANVQDPSPVVEVGDTQQIIDQGTASESPVPSDGRRRSSRLRGKVTLGNDVSPPVLKQSSGSGKRGRRKKAPLEQCTGDSIEGLIAESFAKEPGTQVEDLEASPAGGTLPGEENGTEAMKVETDEVEEGSGTTRPVVDPVCEVEKGTGIGQPLVEPACEVADGTETAPVGNVEGTGIARPLVDPVCEDGECTGTALPPVDSIREDVESTGIARPIVELACEDGEGAGTGQPPVISIPENVEGTGANRPLVDPVCEGGEATASAPPLLNSIPEDVEFTEIDRSLVDPVCEVEEGTGTGRPPVDLILEDVEGTAIARSLVDPLCEDGEGAGTAPPPVDSIREDFGSLVDSRGDFCDSNIFENLQSIVILHPEENAVQNDIPSTCTREPDEKIEKQSGDAPGAKLTEEGIRGEGTSNVNIGGSGKEESAGEEVRVPAGEEVTVPAGEEVTTPADEEVTVPAGEEVTVPADEEVTALCITQGNCEMNLQACKASTVSEAEPVELDLKEEGTSRGSTSISKGGDDKSIISGLDGEHVLKSNGIDGEDSSSVTTRDDIAQTTITYEDKERKVTVGDDAGGGLSKLASEASLNDVHMATNTKLLADESIDVHRRKGVSIRPKKEPNEGDIVGSRRSPEAKVSRVSPPKSRRAALDSQVSVNGNNDQKIALSSLLEGRETQQITSEAAYPRSGEGEDPSELDKKTESLKSVNQEVVVSNGGVPSAMKVNSKADVTRSLSRHAVVGEDDSSGVTEGDVNTTSEKVDESAGINSKAGWVKCDDCKKWRSIPLELADMIGDTNAYWSCKENPNKKFADCSIPQVKSNEEINRDLGISGSSFCDEEDDVDATCDSRPLYNNIQENGQAVWTLIKRNLFKHRSQKHQDADEAMVCQCAPPEAGEVGCGDDCLNRILNVECLPQQCPCGSMCTNQQFQKREYANVELFRCGKKGHGLRALENIRRGSFIIEYVGEVLDMASFEERQKDYSMNSQKHFYFMTLGANEIIDACSKGNLGRFINHSCEPNCATEKWMVDGEVCIGLFAIRDIKEGEEVTFDYNFVRVGGADAKKCECGASKCRGFIGVDPDTPQNVVDIDSDEGEDPEPIMLLAESDEEFDDKSKEGSVKRARMMAASDNRNEKLGGLKRKYYLGAAKDKEEPKRKRRVKTASSTKIGSHAPAPSKLFVNSRFASRSTYHSDVEGKLGELTNESGGLTKQRDTAKQYLKLLVLTAASGGTVNGAAACSARDLSMLLEALLKTQRFSLLKDIMNKNGLQMFHNLLKQFRKSFEKRPILRKLLKVLDHLAKNRVLTVEHIYSPPRSGTECFSDTLFDLSRHDDTEVQRMARDFRKQYVPPRPQKPIVNPERALVKSPLQQQPSAALSSPLVTESSQLGSTASNSAEQTPPSQVVAVEEKPANPPTRRKRPSRWDTAPDSVTAAINLPTPLQGLVHPPPVVPGPADPPPGVSGRPPAPFPPVDRNTPWGQQAGYPPGHRPTNPRGHMNMGMQRAPMGNELPPAAQRPYPAMQGPVPRPLPYAYNRGPSNQHGQWPFQHPMYPGPAFPPPPPPLPPGAVRPGWGHRQPDGFPTEAAGEPPVPGMSPASLRGKESSTSRAASDGAAPRPFNERSEAPAQRTRRDEQHGARTQSGHHESTLVDRPRSSVPEITKEIPQQAYAVPNKGQKEICWETPECSNFHHHVSGMIRNRVEMKHLVHYKDLEKFCSKLTEVVTRKEIKKYRENKVQGMTKTILRSKLLEKVDAYVDLQIDLYSQSKSGEGQS